MYFIGQDPVNQQAMEVQRIAWKKINLIVHLKKAQKTV